MSIEIYFILYILVRNIDHAIHGANICTVFRNLVRNEIILRRSA